MGVSRRFSLLFGFIFLLTLVVIVMYLGFSLLQNVFCSLFEDKNLVTEEARISELQESITKYYDYLYFGQYEKAKNSTSLLGRLSDNAYGKYHDYICSLGEYTVVVKYAYRLYLDTYRCYVVTYDKTKNDLSFIMFNNKEKMDKIVISLDRFNNNFSIIDVYFPGVLGGEAAL